MNKEQITAECQKFTDELVDFINSKISKDFKCQTKFDWNSRRVASRGGKWKDGSIRISIAMNRYVLEGPQKFTEYASFDKDKFIGGFSHKDFWLPLKAVICHEITHAWIANCIAKKVQPHGSEWKHHYRYLREKFINPYIDKKLSLKADYSKYKDSDFSKYGLPSDIHEKSFITKDHTFKVIGINLRARKYHIVTERTKDKKQYVFSAKEIKYFLLGEGTYELLG